MNEISSEARAETSQPEAITVEAAKLQDLSQMVEIHAQTNPQAYLTSLGKPVLRSLYRYFIRNPRGIALVARDGLTKAVAGVAIGCEHPRRFYRGLAVAVLPAYAWTFILRLFRHETARVGPAQRYRHQANLFPRQDIVYFTQLNVSPAFQRRRVGSTLAGAMYDEVRRRGYTIVSLITDQDNTSVRALHEKMGCKLVRKFTTPSGIQRCLYLKELEPNPANTMDRQETM